MIFHIADRADWQRALEAGEYRADSLASEGFIHCSTREQLIGVANAFYAEQSDLVALCVDEAKLNVVTKWEAPAHPPGSQTTERDDESLFPHIYGPIAVDAVVKVVALHTGEQGFALPPELP